jgi:hypothetical protein
VFLASASQSRDSFIFPNTTIQDGTPETIFRTAPRPSLKHAHPIPSSFAPSSPNTTRGSPRFSLVSDPDMDVDEDLSASTYTFDSSLAGPSASASAAFSGMGHGPPSALSILLARKQEGKGLLGTEQVTARSTSEYSVSQMSVTPTNERPGDAYFSSVAADPPPLGPQSPASAEAVEPGLPDQPRRLPDETTPLLCANHAIFHHEDANNGSRPMFVVTKTQPEHAKPVIPRDYGSIVFLSKPSETLRRFLDPNLGRTAFRALPAVVLGTLLNILDGISCTCFHSLLHPGCPTSGSRVKGCDPAGSTISENIPVTSNYSRDLIRWYDYIPRCGSIFQVRRCRCVHVFRVVSRFLLFDLRSCHLLFITARRFHVSRWKYWTKLIMCHHLVRSSLSLCILLVGAISQVRMGA